MTAGRELQGNVDHAEGQIGIVVAKFNQTVTTNLLRGALDTLQSKKVDSERITVAWVPGAWEVPVVAQRFAEIPTYRAVICLAAVVRGDTTHDRYINSQVSQSLGQIALEARIPVLFGVLTCQTLEQAMQRSGGNVGNKGSDCAFAALEMMDLMQQLSGAEPRSH